MLLYIWLLIPITLGIFFLVRKLKNKKSSPKEEFKSSLSLLYGSNKAGALWARYNLAYKTEAPLPEWYRYLVGFKDVYGLFGQVDTTSHVVAVRTTTGLTLMLTGEKRTEAQDLYHVVIDIIGVPTKELLDFLTGGPDTYHSFLSMEVDELFMKTIKTTLAAPAQFFNLVTTRVIRQDKTIEVIQELPEGTSDVVVNGDTIIRRWSTAPHNYLGETDFTRSTIGEKYLDYKIVGATNKEHFLSGLDQFSYWMVPEVDLSKFTSKENPHEVAADLFKQRNLQSLAKWAKLTPSIFAKRFTVRTSEGIVFGARLITMDANDCIMAVPTKKDLVSIKKLIILDPEEMDKLEEELRELLTESLALSETLKRYQKGSRKTSPYIFS